MNSDDSQVEMDRELKDRHFKCDANSPIPPSERANFAGLNYYPVNSAYRFKVRLQKYPNPETLFMGTTKGGTEEYIRIGFFEFTVNGSTKRLQVYRTGPTNPFPTDNLFIAFRDKTSGIETYGAGRYIELPEDRSGICTLDFNTAHNPLCAYSDAHSCPIAPVENWLDLEIRAGEKSYKKSVSH